MVKKFSDRNNYIDKVPNSISCFSGIEPFTTRINSMFVNMSVLILIKKVLLDISLL